MDDAGCISSLLMHSYSPPCGLASPEPPATRVRSWWPCSPGIRRFGLEAAMSSGGDSAARPMPRLARVFEGRIEPLDAGRLAQQVDVAFLAVPEQAAADLGASLVDAGVRVIDLSGAFRLRDAGERLRWYPGDRRRCRRRGVRAGRALPGRREARAARRLPGLLSDRGAPGAAAARASRAARRGRGRGGRCQVGHLRRRPHAQRSNALLGEPRLRLRVRHVRPPARRRDGAGAGRRGHVRSAPGAARPRHPRNDLRPGRRARPQTQIADAFNAARTATSRSCG